MPGSTSTSCLASALKATKAPPAPRHCADRNRSASTGRGRPQALRFTPGQSGSTRSVIGRYAKGGLHKKLNPPSLASRLLPRLGPDLDQMPNSSFIVREVVAIDCALARSSALFFGLEKPWPVPL